MPDLALDFRYLRFAIAAAEHGSFRQTALALEVSQSTVSRRIQLLEHRLGFELFQRDRSGAHLTSAGKNFLKEAAPGMHQLRRAVQLAAARHRGEVGELNIGTSASLATGFLHLALKEFRESHPGVKITLFEGTAQESLHRLAVGQLDVIFVTGEHALAGHVAEVLWNERIFFALPTNHKLASKSELAWQDVKGESFVVSSGGPGPEIQACLMKTLADIGSHPAIDVHDVSRESLMDLVAIGYGLTVTSTSAVRTTVTGVVFKALVGEAEHLPLRAVWSSSNANPALQNLLKLAKLVARKSA
ncbi:LysR family transcriptional regulator [Bradyrhizobium sp. 156]|uniref:LysR family transcriptional regulator n=1 Tax=Bradyrhizobium sp. 156 TaxID=2782630 RepID=UPI001FF888B2|nr:LysR family transcriptional regulator [Bradyrhizobium sp. 156]MCK1323582.1 LysR family transcriptional regulator [Bradyrhizobium sp. 156]